MNQNNKPNKRPNIPDPCIFNLNPSSLPPEAGFVNRKLPSEHRIPNINNAQSFVQPNRTKQLARTGKFVEYPLYSSSNHSDINVLRFNSNTPVRMQDFVPPVRILRKDINEIAKENEATNNPKKDEETTDGVELPDASKIAPYGGLAKTRQNYFQRKTKQVTLLTKKEKESQKEDNNPWVIEDFETKNNWQGSLEGEKLGRYYALVVTEQGFRALPISKHYTFNKKISYRTLTADEAENIMNGIQKKEIKNRWFMRARDEIDKQATKEKEYRPKLKTVDTGEDMLEYYDEEDVPNKKRNSKLRRDMEEMDYEEDVQDDDEGQIEYQENDEDQKENKDRIKKEHMQYDNNSDLDFEDFEDVNTNLTNTGKKMKKLVNQFGKGDTIASDDENEDPYASSDKNNSDADNDGEKNMDEKSAQLFKLEFEKAIKGGDKPSNKALSSSQKASNPKKQNIPAKSPPAEDRNLINAGSIKHNTPKSKNVANSSLAELLTEKDVIEAIKNKRPTTKDLVASFKSRIRANIENKKLMGILLKKIATNVGGIWELKPQYK